MSHSQPDGAVANGVSGVHHVPEGTDPQVVPKAERRRFSAEYKQRILAEADTCTQRGQVGALLRREGLYASHLEKWRQQRDQATRAALAPQKRGPKPDPQAAEIARLQQENERLTARLAQAEALIEVQKKLSTLFGPTSTATRASEGS